MRDALKNAVQSAILFECQLPHQETGIDKSCLSSQNDIEKVDIESVSGLGLLLQKLEYNALSPKARKVSDFGVPFKLIDCYDSQTEYDKDQFDPYEKRVDEQVSRLFQ